MKELEKQARQRREQEEKQRKKAEAEEKQSQKKAAAEEKKHPKKAAAPAKKAKKPEPPQSKHRETTQKTSSDSEPRPPACDHPDPYKLADLCVSFEYESGRPTALVRTTDDSESDSSDTIIF
jgi:hypothetical protein